MATHRTGGEVDALCTRCKMTLGHTIVAMVGTRIARVRCNTCGGDHAFRRPAGTPARSAPGTRTTRAERPDRVALGFEARLAGRELSQARPYAAGETYRLDDVVQHPTFGLGIVSAVRQDKVDVEFKAAVRTLIHGRGHPAERPTFRPPQPSSGAPADKPVSDRGPPG